MMLTALALLFASALCAGAVMLLDCALRGRKAYLALTSQRDGLVSQVPVITVSQLASRSLSAANAEGASAMAVQLRAAA